MRAFILALAFLSVAFSDDHQLASKEVTEVSMAESLGEQALEGVTEQTRESRSGVCSEMRQKLLGSQSTGCNPAKCGSCKDYKCTRPHLNVVAPAAGQVIAQHPVRLDMSGSWGFSFWFKTPAASGNVLHLPILKNNQQNSPVWKNVELFEISYKMEYGYSQIRMFNGPHCDGECCETMFCGVPLGQWSYVAVLNDPHEMTMYVNGKQGNNCAMFATKHMRSQKLRKLGHQTWTLQNLKHGAEIHHVRFYKSSEVSQMSLGLPPGAEGAPIEMSQDSYDLIPVLDNPCTRTGYRVPPTALAAITAPPTCFERQGIHHCASAKVKQRDSGVVSSRVAWDNMPIALYVAKSVICAKKNSGEKKCYNTKTAACFLCKDLNIFGGKVAGPYNTEGELLMNCVKGGINCFSPEAKALLPAHLDTKSPMAMKDGDRVAFWNPECRKFVRMNEQTGLIDMSSERADATIAPGWAWEVFTVTETKDGSFMFWNSHQKRFLRLHGHQDCFDRSQVADEPTEVNGWTWERFRLVNGETNFNNPWGGIKTVGLFNPLMKRFMRMHCNKHCVDKSSEKSDGLLEPSWKAERFRVVYVGPNDEHHPLEQRWARALMEETMVA